MAQLSRGLGRGLESLIPAGARVERTLTSGTPSQNNTITQVAIDKIRPNRFQPRTHFDEAALQDLAASIRTQGLIQPLVVSPILNPEADGPTHELIAGERRWRASKLANLTQVPVVVREVSDAERFQMALIENIQREDLNPIEEAVAFKKIMEVFSLTQEELSRVIGKGRVVISNTLRLLNLPTVLQEAVANGTISAGHARNLVSIGDENLQKQLAEKILSEQLTVRDVERFVQDLRGPDKARKPSKKFKLEPEMENLRHTLEQNFGTRIHLRAKGSGAAIKGSIEIAYFSLEDLERISALLLGKPAPEK